MKRDSSFPFYFFPPSPPTERSRKEWEGRGGGLVEETGIGRQEKGIRALFEAFFSHRFRQHPVSLSLSSDLYSSRHRGLVYKIFALVMRPWLSNRGAVTVPPCASKRLERRQIEEFEFRWHLRISCRESRRQEIYPYRPCQETFSRLFSQTRRIRLQRWPLSNEHIINTGHFTREILYTRSNVNLTIFEKNSSPDSSSSSIIPTINPFSKH